MIDSTWDAFVGYARSEHPGSLVLINPPASAQQLARATESLGADRPGEVHDSDWLDEVLEHNR